MSSVKSSSKRNILYIYLSSLFGNGYFERAIFMLYLLEQGYSLLQVGFLQSLVNLAMFVCEMPTGMFADRFGRKNSIIVGRVLIILYFVALIFADHFSIAIVAFLLLGVGVTFISGSEEALLFESSKEQGKENEFTRISGRYAAIITLVLAFVMGVGGYLKEISWASVFLVSIGFQVLGLVFTLFLKEIKSQGEEEGKSSFTQFIKDTADFLRMNGALRALIVGIAVYSGVISIFLLFVQQLLSEAGYATYVISTIAALISLVSAVASDRVYLLENRFSPRSVVRATVAIAGVFFLIMFAQIPALLVVAYLLIECCLYLFTPITYTLINLEIPSAQRATLLSVMNFISSLVMFVLSPVIGYMADQFGSQKFLAIVGALSMILVWVCLSYFFKAKKNCSVSLRPKE